MEKEYCYRFEKFTYYPNSRMLYCGKEYIPLQQKTSEVLLFFLRNPGTIFTREELTQKIWSEYHVDESNVIVQIATLRKILGPSSTTGKPFVENVPKKGYLFSAAVELIDNNFNDTAINTKKNSLWKRWNSDKNFRLRKFIFLTALIIILTLVTITSFFYKTKRDNDAEIINYKIAVLPFVNLKSDPETDFLSFSLADTIISRLNNVEVFIVRPSASIRKFNYKRIEDTKEIVKALNVNIIVTGTYLKDGDTLRITSQMIKTDNNQILQLDTFTLNYKNLLSLQDKVALQILDSLKIKLSQHEIAAMQQDVAADPLAYEKYLQGVSLYWNNNIPMAIDVLKKSIDLDPNYAPSWYFLGLSYTQSAIKRYGGQGEYDLASFALKKALEVNPRHIEARVLIANIYTRTNRVEAAVPILRETVTQNPNNFFIHFGLMHAYRYSGLMEAAESECEKAQKANSEIRDQLLPFWIYLYRGKYDKYLYWLSTREDLDHLCFYRGYGYFYKKDWQEAAANFEKAYQINPNSLHSQLGGVFQSVINKNPSKGLKILKSIEEKFEQHNVTDGETKYLLVQCHALLQDKAGALKWFRKNIESGFFPYPLFINDPLIQNLQDEPTFTKLLEISKSRHESFKKKFFN